MKTWMLWTMVLGGVLLAGAAAMAQPAVERPGEDVPLIVAGPAPAESQETLAAYEWARGIARVGATLGAGVIVVGGGLSISRIASHALESIARQPEAATQLFLAWLLPAAMIEGSMLFAVVLCLLVVV